MREGRTYLAARLASDDGVPAGAKWVMLHAEDRLLALLLATALAAPLVTADDPEGPLRQRLAEDDADLVLLYGAEQEGELGPCGCDAVERGGVERIRGYARAAARGEAPVLLLNAGGWLDPRPLQEERNAAMVEAVADWDALHLGFRDAAAVGPWLGQSGPWTGEWRPALPEGLVSASIHGPWSAWRVVERGGLKVAITGVSPAKSPERWPAGLSSTEPVHALRAAMAEAPAADVHVVLAYETGALTDELAAVEGVDVLIESGGYTARWQADTAHGALWVRATRGTTRLGELRLWLEDGAVTRAVDRQVAVDRAVPKRATR